MQTVGFYSWQDYPRCHMTVLHTLWTRPASLLRWPTKQHTALKTDLSFYAAIEYKTRMAPNKLVIICSPIRIWNTWIWMSSRAKVSSHRTALIGHRLRSSAARHQHDITDTIPVHHVVCPYIYLLLLIQTSYRGMARLSWPGYHDGLLLQRPISVLTTQSCRVVVKVDRKTT